MHLCYLHKWIGDGYGTSNLEKWKCRRTFGRIFRTLIVLDDTFHVMAHHRPLGFTDPLFQDAVRQGEIPYEAGAIISQSEALSAGREDYIKLDGSDYRRRFAPLISSGVQLGYFICVDTDGHLQSIPPEIWNTVEQVLAKQAFIEASRQNKPFETAEDILMHLLDGGFSSAPYFRLQASGTYLADFHPTGFALIDLTAYHNEYLGKRHLKDELGVRFPQSHSFLYRGDVFLFLHGKTDSNDFSVLAEEFQLRVVISDGIDDLFELSALYRTAREALELMMDRRFHGGNVCTVAPVLRNALSLSDLLPISEEDLRCPFYPSKYGALPYPQNRGRFCHSFG